MKLRKSVYIIVAVLALGPFVPGNDADAQLRLPGGIRELPRTPGIDLDRRTRDRVDETVNETVDETVEAAGEPVESAAETATTVTGDGAAAVEQVAGQAGELVAAANALLRSFVGGVDPLGRDIEDEIIVVLVDLAEVDKLATSAAEVISRRDLPALGQSLVVLRRASSLPLPDTIELLRDANPGATVDYNHLYRLTSETAPEPAAEENPEATSAAAVDADTLRIGIIDSAVMREHRALQDVDINARDFAAHGGYRPLTHGTAVASLVAKSARNDVAIFSASVFFQVPNHAPGATAESMVAALDWLASEEVDVVNMSLAGPENRILGKAIDALVARGDTIVAAVGNNGPSGEPLYPAAYDGVIGVTAVDRKNKIFRYANRGKHVDYAAAGVDLKVADSTTGGWRIESGTSMASPHVAVVAAQVLRSSAVKPDALMSWLMASAEDLGRKGFDKVFGHGLITRPPLVVSAN